LRGEDALFARDAGAAAVWVSAHGGRQLDSVVAPLDVLPEVADALQGALPVILDGEIRSGADVAKALALGADVAAVGRPVLWGLAAAGQQGVERVLALLVDQLANVIALLGASSPAGLGRAELVRVER
jgi:4-hydroxymandelate oxidase